MTSLIHFKFNLHPAIVLFLCPSSLEAQDSQWKAEHEPALPDVPGWQSDTSCSGSSLLRAWAGPGLYSWSYQTPYFVKSTWQEHLAKPHLLPSETYCCIWICRITFPTDSPCSLSLLAAEQKLSGGFQDQGKTDARKSCQINGARSELHHIIWKKKVFGVTWIIYCL